MTEKTNRSPITEGEKYFDNGEVKTTYKFTNGRISSITIEVFDEDVIPKVDLLNKRINSVWLNRINAMLVDMMSSPPQRAERVIQNRPNPELMPPKDYRKIDPAMINEMDLPYCKLCNSKGEKIKMVITRPCCGKDMHTIICPKCGFRAKIKVNPIKEGKENND